MTGIKISRAVSWENISFIGGMTLLAAIGFPIYLYHFGFSWLDFGIFLFWFVATAMGITVGYHRLFAHKTYEGNIIVQLIALFFGSAAFEQSAMEWASQHRQHHGKVDTDHDPYSIKKGLFFAHVGWLLFSKRSRDYSNIKDLQKNPLLVNQDNYYLLWAIPTGILTPILLSAWLTNIWHGIVVCVALRVTLVYHVTFSINSISHYFGKATYDPTGSAKDNWILAFFTMGEGFHSFHHRFPTDYRNGVRWYHWDPSKWMINIFAALGWAKNLNRSPKEVIRQAMIEAKEIRQMKAAG